MTWQNTLDIAEEHVATEINPYRRLCQADSRCRRAEPEIPRAMRHVAPDLQNLFQRLVTAAAPWPLYLWGQPGRGKTLAGLSLCDQVANAYFYTPKSLIGICSRDRLWLPWESQGQRYMDIALSVLDEVGAGEVSQWHFEMVKDFCDDREQRHHRVAVYMSNLPPAQLESKYDPRIASRMVCGTTYELTGPDRRMVTRRAVESGQQTMER